MEFGITQVSYAQCVADEIDPGILVFGRVQIVPGPLRSLYAILDGGWWAHPGLQLYAAQDVGINFDPDQQRLQVVTWPEQKPLAVIDVAPIAEPIRLSTWLAANPGKAVDFRRLLRTGWMPLSDLLFMEIPDGVIIAEGTVRYTMGAINGLGGDAEIIIDGGIHFYSREMPELLASCVRKYATVIKSQGRLTVVLPGAPEA